MVKIIILSLFLVTPCFAEEIDNSILNNLQISISPKQEISAKTENEKIAKAISDASYYAYQMREDLIYFDYNRTLSIVKKCRYEYEKNNPDMPFIEYVAKDINKRYVNCENWKKYYEAFKE